MKEDKPKQTRSPTKSSSISRCLVGAVEFGCFLKQATNRYTNSKSDAIFSFWVVGASLVFDILFLLSIQENNESLKDWGIDQIIIFDTIRVTFVLSMNLLFTYTLCKIHRKTENFWKFLTAYNWLSSFFIILYSPLLIMLALGIHTTADMANLLVLTWIYSYSVIAFLIRHTLQISMPMAVYLAFIFFTMEYLSSSILLG